MFIPFEQRIAALVVTDPLYHRHEDGIIGHLAGSLLSGDFLICLFAEEQHGGESAVAGLKRVLVQVNARENLRLLHQPLPDITESRRAENGIG